MFARYLYSLAGAAIAFLLAAMAFGQAVSGNISGTISDPSGAAVPNATVTITDLDRGAVYHVQSSSDGNFSQTHLLAGHYQVTVESPGFGKFTANAMVEIDATTPLDVKLAPASVQTSVEVTDVTPLLTTDRAEIATTLTGTQVQQLPVLDRNVTNLLLIVPGTQLNTWQHSAAENPQQGIQANANGQFFTANGFLLDGTENDSAILGIAVINPDVDSLQEFKVSTSNYEAEFGSAAGALIQATTKSGTNQWHGSLFEYLRNNITNATNPFTQLNPPLRWNQFGGSVGFPVLKDKLFGFFDYQGTRRRTGGSVLTTVPTAAERNGDLSALLGNYICADGSVSTGPCANPAMVPTTEGGTVAARDGMVFNPNTGAADGSGREAYTVNGQPNMIPVTAPMQKLLSLLPLPNNGSSFFNNYISDGVQRFNTDQYDGRVDYNWSTKTHIFGRYTIADFNNYAPAAFGDAGGGPSAFQFSGDSIDRNQSLALGLDHTFSPTLVTDARFGFYRYRIRVQPNDAGTTPAQDAGLPGLNTGSPSTTGLPAFYIVGSGGFNFGYGLNVNQCNCPLKETENQFQWVDNWTKITGNHTIKFGADIRRAQQQRIPSDTHRSGEITFNASETGDFGIDQLAAGSASTGSGLASYLLGLPATFGRYYTAYDYYPGLRQTRLFFFGQDSWRVTSKLTVNYGLRWEDYLPQVAAKPGGAGSFDPSTGEVLVAGVGSVPINLGVQAYNKLFEPRIGIAYQAAPKTVVRTGFGISATPSGLGSVFGQGADYNPPIVNAQSVTQSNIYFAPFNLLNGPPVPVNPPVGSNGRYPLPNGIGINYFTDPLNSYRIPEVYFWNFTVQQQLTSTMALEVAYVGNVGRHLYENVNRNQAVPGPGDLNPRRPFYNPFGLTQYLTQYCNCTNSNYNALQTKFQKQFSRGLDFLFTYTWSKAMDYASEGAGGAPSNIYAPQNDYGPASWDRTQEITFTYNWDIPVGRNRHWNLGNNAVADAIVGGWRLSGVNTWGTGLPFTPTVANAPLLNDPDFSQVRADVIGNPSVPNPNASQWFNVAAFSEPLQPFRQGTAGRNSLRGPDLWETDVSLSKNVIPSERWRLELRADAFNVFNHVNLGNPSSTIDASGAGQITYIQVPMRQMQFGLHFQF
ncbi:MAG: TonB-dependent receptor [Acidobacteriaceae bacterium]|nr:TonB-dependent receptor [Acidobacteriaceae bacterium]MBV9503156.1 TonB-dependent receptor [Acidobacteriaceae bacterium]